ncbi:hypothetical protein C8250_016830 [Streptomyces sp. So13.3]|uniref:hypothetical protein n=1 Tax=Streptomyces sp. So13.3 TaxID=2136173 RepID=UPI0011058F7B|nr:hypothetical protein [Streptomyces sp. So13.3]QNA73365.1 hypothetical protein C8250_016830 [Streptomyces sp. So13.3]
MTDPQLVPVGNGTAGIAEPALRPSARRHPGLDIVRNARIHRDGRELVVRTRDGRERRYATGPGGIERAVHVDAVGPWIDGSMTVPPRPGTWGFVELQDGDGRRVLRIDVEPWLPESPVLSGVRPDRDFRILELTGLAPLLKDAGIPVRTVRDREDELVARSGAGNATYANPGRLLPRWNTLGRGAVMAVWFLAFAVAIFPVGNPPRELWVVTAAAALVMPVLNLAARLQARLRERRADVPPVESRIAPDPLPGSGASVRFCATAAVRVQERDIVLVDSLGRERWLARSGPHRVAALVRVLESANGTPLGVEFQGPGGEIRAVLPWEPWFGGPEGEARWTQLRSSTGRGVNDRVQGKKERWPASPVGQADVGLMTTLPAATARQASRFPATVLGGGGTWPVLGMALLSLLGCARMIGGHPSAGAAGTALGSLALCGTLVPLAAHSLRSRLRLDRPAQGQAPDNTSRQEPRS